MVVHRSRSFTVRIAASTTVLKSKVDMDIWLISVARMAAGGFGLQIPPLGARRHRSRPR